MAFTLYDVRGRNLLETFEEKNHLNSNTNKRTRLTHS